MTENDRLIAQMSLAEKIGQLTMVTAGPTVTGPGLAEDATEAVRAGQIGSVLNLTGADPVNRLQRLAVEETRLGIPLLFGFDVIHGYRTIFPIPLAEAATFDPELWRRTAAEAAAEAAAAGISLTFAPMLDVARDPRWGRIAEGPGEDPLVASIFAQAKVQGFQGQDPGDPDRIGATAKHFVAYGAATAGRDYASADISERTLREVYLPPFEAAVKAGAVAVMPSFQDLAGIPMTANGRLVSGWLRERTGFAGIVVSDYHAIAELMNHSVARDLSEAAALAMNAGVDVDMMGGAYRLGLPRAIERGLVDMEQVDGAVARVLAVKRRLGLFNRPFIEKTSGPDATAHLADRQNLALEAATRSIVLLTNDGTLPIAATIKKLAVVGPLAHAPAEMLGPWSGHGDPAAPVSILTGIIAALPHVDVIHAGGVDLDSTDLQSVSQALEDCRSADLVILCLGEAALMSGEAASRALPDLPGMQSEFAQAVFEQGKPVVLLLSSGRSLTATPVIARANAALATWFLGDQAGHAIAQILTGARAPSGKLPIAWPRATGQMPIFYGQRPTGRPANPNDHYTSKYLDLQNTPLFPFGHGLSYGRPSYINLTVHPRRFIASDVLEVSVDIANDGSVAIEETVFLFVRDLVASVARPVLELKAFAKLSLNPGTSGRMIFHLQSDMLTFLNQDLQPALEPGDFEILVGPSADRDQLLKTTVTLVEG